MIKEVVNEQKFKEYFFNFNYSDIYMGKLLALYEAYGFGSKFCRFFVQYNDYANEVLLLAKIGNEFSLCIILQDKKEEDYIDSDSDSASEDDFENLYNDSYGENEVEQEDAREPDFSELACFLKMMEARTVFLSEKLLLGLEKYISGEWLYNCIMEYEKVSSYKKARNINLLVNNKKTPESFRLDEVCDILLPEFKFDKNIWIPDISHRIRHGISAVYLYSKASTVTALYDYNNFVFLTQVATKESKRGKGLATAMLKLVCNNYKSSGKQVFLVCRESMKSFYEKVGFKQIGKAGNIYSIDKTKYKNY